MATKKAAAKKPAAKKPKKPAAKKPKKPAAKKPEVPARVAARETDRVQMVSRLADGTPDQSEDYVDLGEFKDQ